MADIRECHDRHFLPLRWKDPKHNPCISAKVGHAIVKNNLEIRQFTDFHINKGNFVVASPSLANKNFIDVAGTAVAFSIKSF